MKAMGAKWISGRSFCDIDFTPMEEIIHNLLIKGAKEDVILKHLDDYKISLQYGSEQPGILGRDKSLFLTSLGASK